MLFDNDNQRSNVGMGGHSGVQPSTNCFTGNELMLNQEKLD